jgi:hypothetical protein
VGPNESIKRGQIKIKLTNATLQLVGETVRIQLMMSTAPSVARRSAPAPDKPMVSWLSEDS